ncbi:MAG: PhzF family phenazine biosynthesis protein [Polaromonas sp.]|uniref:PhzF family phenazine biosynthesis protein n=1 Tax=Polaromonas sp. TaxID=1869339 RepID=UPI0027368501|nr:PhzF family phenazine biosynthesis protein [Polaromonas sp.]MDP2819817.1 PhzF family phenazine biosynthesis protein [Polaromonas sp.]
MAQRAFKQVDVFTAQPYFGNPLAVVLDGSGLDDAAMQRFAQWTNLSETTFVLPPTEPSADYRVRIFTPGGELPFAGHPTLGTCHAWLQAGGVPQRKDVIVQQCEVGLINIRREGARQAFAAPRLKRSAPSPVVLAQVAAALGLKPQRIIAAQVLDNGPVWLGLLLDSADTVLQLEPDHLALKKYGLKVGVAGAHSASVAPVLIARANREAQAFAGNTPVAPTETADFEVRAFAAPIGIHEDPVTGSLNASLAQWLMAEGHAPDNYVVAQGTCLGRAGRVHLSRETTAGTAVVWVGGESVTCIDGSVTL